MNAESLSLSFMRRFTFIPTMTTEEFRSGSVHEAECEHPTWTAAWPWNRVLTQSCQFQLEWPHTGSAHNITKLTWCPNMAENWWTETVTHIGWWPGACHVTWCRGGLGVGRGRGQRCRRPVSIRAERWRRGVMPAQQSRARSRDPHSLEDLWPWVEEGSIHRG